MPAMQDPLPQEVELACGANCPPGPQSLGTPDMALPKSLKWNNFKIMKNREFRTPLVSCCQTLLTAQVLFFDSVMAEANPCSQWLSTSSSSVKSC